MTLLPGLPDHVDRAIRGGGDVRLDIRQGAVAELLERPPSLIRIARHGVDVPVPLRLLGPDEPGSSGAIHGHLWAPQVLGSPGHRDEAAPALVAPHAQIELLALIVIALPRRPPPPVPGRCACGK